MIRMQFFSENIFLVYTMYIPGLGMMKVYTWYIPGIYQEKHFKGFQMERDSRVKINSVQLIHLESRTVVYTGIYWYIPVYTTLWYIMVYESRQKYHDIPLLYT